MKGISVVICCFNSTSRLERTLSYLANQETSSDLDWELVIVDNASTDETSNFAKQLWDSLDKSDRKITVVSQPIPGLTHARQKGAEVAQYDVIIYCDDDNWLTHNYLQSAYDLMKCDDVAIACGYGIAVTNKSFPIWFTHVFPFYGCHAFEGSISSQHQELEYGAGIVIRKSFLNQINKSGYNYYLKGRRGTNLSSGEDTEIILLARILGYKVINSKKLRFHHYIPEARLSKQYVYRLVEGVCFNGLKLEPFKVYLKNVKPLTNITWLKDTINVIRYFIKALLRHFVRNSFESKLQLLMNWHAVQCSFTNFNQYGEIGERLDNLKQNFRKS